MTRTIRPLAICAAVAATSFIALPAAAATLVGLVDGKSLALIDSDTKKVTKTVAISGAPALVGIDQRPADGMLYGLAADGTVFTVDVASGKATQKSKLSTMLPAGAVATVDFNPVADRLRLMGMNGTNFRVNVATGEVARDGQLKYQAGTPWAETQPRITAGAYTNSLVGAQATALYTLDPLARAWNLQAPPNDGVQQPKAELPAGLPPGLAFDILSDAQGGNAGFLLAAGTLHRVDTATGQVTPAGAVTGLPAAEIIDIAAMR